jgi:hypothetical protein
MLNNKPPLVKKMIEAKNEIVSIKLHLGIIPICIPKKGLFMKDANIAKTDS